MNLEGNLAHASTRQLELISNDQTNLYQSLLGNSFMSSIRNFNNSQGNQYPTDGSNVHSCPSHIFRLPRCWMIFSLGMQAHVRCLEVRLIGELARAESNAKYKRVRRITGTISSRAYLRPRVARSGRDT